MISNKDMCVVPDLDPSFMEKAKGVFAKVAETYRSRETDVTWAYVVLGLTRAALETVVKEVAKKYCITGLFLDHRNPRIPFKLSKAISFFANFSEWSLEGEIRALNPRMPASEVQDKVLRVRQVANVIRYRLNSIKLMYSSMSIPVHDPFSAGDNDCGVSKETIVAVWSLILPYEMVQAEINSVEA